MLIVGIPIEDYRFGLFSVKLPSFSPLKDETSIKSSMLAEAALEPSVPAFFYGLEDFRQYYAERRLSVRHSAGMDFFYSIILPRFEGFKELI